jgi:hypothetical protein
MNVPDVGEGLALGVGESTYRFAMVGSDASVEATQRPIDTPRTPGEFFHTTARWVLDAAQNGAEWGVLGVPGPVSVEVNPDDSITQRMHLTNIPDLNPPEGFDPIAEMTNADPAVEELLDSGFTFLTVNDGDLAALAAAKLYGKGYEVVGDVINGRGTGGAIARRDLRFPHKDLFHPDPGLWEVGHTPASFDFPSQTPEAMISGLGIEKRFGKPANELALDDPVFKEVAHGIGHRVIELAILGSAELVVISGGIGIKAQHGYRQELHRVLNEFRRSRNPMADRVPMIKVPPKRMADTYELHGARGAMVSHLTRRAIAQRILTAD